MFQLTLPRNVAEMLHCLYAQGGVFLEYGTGGSTILALEANENNIVFGCETDPRWLAQLSMEVALRGLSGRFFPVYQDIGLTKEWGHPCFERQPYDNRRGINMIKAPLYPWHVMEDRDISPDVILVDGRFRVASFVASYFSVAKPATLVFDDYVDRPQYHIVESLVDPVDIVDRAAVFRLAPFVGEFDMRRFMRDFAPLMVSVD
jgi:hypothetical protein